MSSPSLLNERHESPEGGANDQNNPQDAEDGTIGTDFLINRSHNRWSHELENPVNEKGNSIGGSQFFRAQHIGHDDGRDSNIDTGSESKNPTVDREDDVVGSCREESERNSRDEKTPDEIPVFRH